jgi:hypothetical protein
MTITDEVFVRTRALYKLQKALQKHKTIYQQQAHRRYGVGMTIAEFDEIVQWLVNSNVCTAKPGPNGGTVLTFNQVVAQ